VKPADAAWVALALAVLGYEAAAATRKDWELLSEAADRYRAGHPVITHLTVFYLAGHLTRRWPRRLDPLHQLAQLTRRP
jgi:hypothetical protein